MKRSAKLDYACRALLELALHWPNPVPLQVNTISERQNIPLKFLTQILINLKQFGLVNSIRGKKGGYLLTKPPVEINLGELIRHFNELSSEGESPAAKAKRENAFDTIWREVDESVWKMLVNINLENIGQREKALTKVQMYTI